MSVRRLAEPALQPASFAFSEANAEAAQDWLKKYPPGRQQSAVIPLLMLAQDQEGWVTKAAIEHVGRMLEMPLIRVLEVATFYTQFQLKPVGSRAHIQVCGTTPCMLRGAEELMAVCRAKIHPDQFHLNADGSLSWEEVECLGACVNAPMVMIAKDTYEDLSAQRFGEIVEAFAEGRGQEVPVGPQVDRLYSAPITGLTSLTSEQVVLKSTRDAEAKAAAAPAGAAAEPSVPPSEAARPKTDAPETDPSVKSPSPDKAPVAAEGAASVTTPAHREASADLASDKVEKTVKPRKRPISKPGPASAYVAPERLKGEPIGADGQAAVPAKPKRRKPADDEGR